MSDLGEPASTGDGPGRPRPDVLACPPSTTARFLLLVVATVAAGLFVGVFVHNMVAGGRWQREVAACAPGLLDPSPGIVAWQADLADCTAGAEQRRAMFALAGLATAAAAAFVIFRCSPRHLERRRRLRPADERFATARQRFAELSHAAGLPRPPTLMTGPATQRDAFSYGLPGNQRVVMPTAVLLRPQRPEFAALAAHELAHVAGRDVTVAWAAKSIGYAVAPLLLVPVLLAVLMGELSLLSDYVWRAVLLGAVVALTRAAILRSREHDADLRAARRGSNVAALSAVLAGMPNAGHRRLRRLLANHPCSHSRIAVLDNPAGIARASFVDGAAAAFLAGLLPSLIDLAVIPLLTGTSHIGVTDLAAAAVTGPLVGATIGLAFWRACLVRRVAGGDVRPAPAAAGVFVGFLLGGAASLAQYGHRPPFLWVPALCAVGATVVTVGLGELWSDAAGRLRRARSFWLSAVIVPGLLFTAVLWAGIKVQKSLEWGGWGLASATLTGYFARPAMVAATMLLALSAAWPLWAARRDTLTPAWLLEYGPRNRWAAADRRGARFAVIAGIVAGACGAAVIGAFRALAGAAQDNADASQRLYTYVLLAGTVAIVAAIAVEACWPGRGAGAALVTTPVAAVTAMVGVVALNTALGGALTWGFVVDVGRQPLGLALLGQTLALSVVAFLPGRDGVARRTGLAATAVVAALAVLAATAVITERDVLVPIAVEVVASGAEGGRTIIGARLAGRGDIPQHSRAVIAGADDGLPVRCEGHRVQDSRVPGQRLPSGARDRGCEHPTIGAVRPGSP
ncbi:M48 family metalloprotease [Actinoplanes sp. NPDC049681]|uniref:M48 family metalloprotease n=1 Tax=Actinoplanes sp. NPDC049681 TaxID=3363905 RepID=UPI003791C04D